MGRHALTQEDLQKKADDFDELWEKSRKDAEDRRNGKESDD